MKLLFRCVKCGRLLGIYFGEPCYLVIDTKTYIGIKTYRPMVICKKCLQNVQNDMIN